MTRSYNDEIQDLRRTKEWVADCDTRGLLRSLGSTFGPFNLIAVGAGGSHAAAVFAAMLHESEMLRLARAATPLSAVSQPASSQTAALIISAGGNNMDAVRAARALPTMGYTPMAALVMRTGSPLAAAMRDVGHATHAFDLPVERDGYLATNTLFATMLLLAQAWGHTAVDLDSSAWAGDMSALTRPTIMVLAHGWAEPAGVDFESRFVEAAFSNVLLTDHRNLAHGRHLWLAQRPHTTGIVSIETADEQDEASAILDHVPDEIPVLRVQTPQRGPSGAVALVYDVMCLLGEVASEHDPAHPTVSDFGRRMYRGDRVGEHPLHEQATR